MKPNSTSSARPLLTAGADGAGATQHVPPGPVEYQAASVAARGAASGRRLSETTPIHNPNVTVRREAPRRFAVWSNGHRWGHFVLRRDAERFAVDVRAGEAFYSEVASRVVTGKVGA